MITKRVVQIVIVFGWLLVLGLPNPDGVRCADAPKGDEDSSQISKRFLALLSALPPDRPERDLFNELCRSSLMIPTMEKGTEIIPELVKGLKRSNEFQTLLIAHTLSAFGKKASVAEKELILLLPQVLRNKRLHLIKVLGDIGPDARKSVPALKEILTNDKDLLSRIAAADSIWRIENKLSDEMRSVYKTALTQPSRDWLTTRAAILSLTNIGPPAKEFEQSLESLLPEKDTGLKFVTAIALVNINPKNIEAANILIVSLKNTNPVNDSSRIEAAQALQKADPVPEAAIATLIEFCDGKTTPRSPVALTLLPNSRLTLNQSLDLLIDALNDQDAFVRQMAAFTLAEIGKGDTNTIKALQKHENDSDIYVRHQIANTIKKVRHLKQHD